MYGIQKNSVPGLQLEFFLWMCHFGHLQCIPIYALLLYSERLQTIWSLFTFVQVLLQLLFPAFQYRLWTNIYRTVLRPLFLERSAKPFTLVILTQIKADQQMQPNHSLSSFNPNPPLFFMNRNKQKVFYCALEISTKLHWRRQKDRSLVSTTVQLKTIRRWLRAAWKRDADLHWLSAWRHTAGT